MRDSSASDKRTWRQVIVSLAATCCWWCAAVACAEEPPSPFGAVDEARESGEFATPAELRRLIGEKRSEAATADSPSEFAYRCLLVAELMKRAGYGHDEAERWYESAANADPDPGYEYFYGEYLRVYRGANRPLFLAAEARYYRASEKLLNRGDPQEWDAETGRRIRRSLIALYERDGFSLRRSFVGSLPAPPPSSKPASFVSSQNLFGISTNDLPSISEVRDFTSEAMFAASPARLNRPLTQFELRSLARAKPQFASLQRIRFRPRALPVVDVLFHQDSIDRASVTNFFLPAEFNSVSIDDVGVSVSSPWRIRFPAMDAWTSVTYREGDRRGTIEFLEDEADHIRHLESTFAFSRFVGPDKLLWETTAVYQDILPQVQPQPTRDRVLAATQLRYFQYRNREGAESSRRSAYDYRFDPRGIEYFAGMLYDLEEFSPAYITRHDVFGGISIRGISRSDNPNRLVKNWDVTLQETWFGSTVDVDSTQTNGQLRTSLVLLGRLKDEEIPPQGDEDVGRWYPAFVHVVFPMKLDLAIDGIDEFENWTAGVQLNSKWYDTRLGGAVFLLSLGYAHQQFFAVDKSLELATLSVNLGF